jgi:hypothetical protein
MGITWVKQGITQRTRCRTEPEQLRQSLNLAMRNLWFGFPGPWGIGVKIHGHQIDLPFILYLDQMNDPFHFEKAFLVLGQADSGFTCFTLRLPA